MTPVPPQACKLVCVKGWKLSVAFCTRELSTLERKCNHFNHILVIGFSRSFHLDNFWCDNWWTFGQNENISVQCIIGVPHGQNFINTHLSTYWITWWRHQVETFSSLLAFCVGNSPVTAEFHAQRPVTRSFDVFFDLRPKKWLSKQWRRWWFETPSCSLWHHSNEFRVLYSTLKPVRSPIPMLNLHWRHWRLWISQTSTPLEK